MAHSDDGVGWKVESEGHLRQSIAIERRGIGREALRSG